MPYRTFRPQELTYDAHDFGLIDNERLELRRVDATGAYDRTQVLPSDGAVISTALWFNRALEIDEGWRFVYVEAQRPRDPDTYEFLGYIDYQIGDNTHWWYHTGAAWAEVADAAADWASEDDVIDSFATYPGKRSRYLRVRLRVRPDSTGDYAPQVTGVCVTWPVDFVYQTQDDVIRSLQEYCAALTIPAVEQVTLEADSATVTLTSDYTPLGSGSWKVYNLTTDSARSTNLFSSWLSPTVTMTAMQDEDSDIEVRFEGTLPAYISADEFSDDSESPSFVIQSGEARVDREISQAGNELRFPEPGLTAYRVEHVAETLQLSFRVYAQAAKHYIARGMIAALERKAQLNCGMLSYGWGGAFTFRLIERASSSYTQIGRGLHVFALPLEVLAPQLELARESQLEPAFQKIKFTFGSTSTVYGTVEISR